MTLYYGIIFIDAFLAVIFPTQTRRIQLCIMIVLLMLIVGFRSYQVGSDTLSYVTTYNLIGNSDISSFKELFATNFLGDGRLEPGFIYLISGLNKISSNPQLIMIFEALILYVSLYFLIRDFSLNYPLSIFFVITLGTFITSMNLLRQFIAMGFCLIGYYFFTEGRKYYFAFFVLTAGIFFHRTAIIFLVLLITQKFVFNKKILLISLAIFIAILADYNALMGLIFKIFPYYQNYQNAVFGVGKLSATFKICFALLTLGFGLYTKDHGEFNSVFTLKRWNEMSFLILLSVLFTMLSFRFTQIDRISIYFTTFYVLYIPNCILANRNKWIRFYSTVAFICIAIFYFNYMLLFKDNWNQVLPYSFFF